jgi:hypothetical protein
LRVNAPEREPISRVQSDALKKEFFVGAKLQDPSDDPEFYGAATVVDVPYGVDHGLFSGAAGGLKRRSARSGPTWTSRRVR